MTQPQVTINEIDGALGVLPDGAQITSVMGYAAGGTVNVPATFARTKDAIAYLVAGPACELACLNIELYKRPVLVVPTAATVVGDKGTLVTSGVTGTSVVTNTGTPNDDYEAAFRVIAGGTIGVTGITYQWSLDGERNWSPVTQLGTANTFAFPGAGSLGLAFAAGTLVAGDKVTCRTKAPQWNSTDLGTGFDALIATIVNWREVQIAGAIDATSFDLIETKMASLDAAGRPKAWVGHMRVPNVGESEATYKTAMDAIFASKASKYGSLYSGGAEVTSAVISGRKYLRPAGFEPAALGASVKEHINIADVNLGKLKATSIRDVNGNPKHHDESINPGLDDSRYAVLRTWEPDLQGVYVNRPRLFSVSGSDFQLLPHRLVMNKARAAARAYFIRRLNRPILVNKKTGLMLETERLDIENGVDAAIRAAIMSEPMASGGGYDAGKFASISATDNLLSTKKITGSGRLIPLAYPEYVDFDLGFYNPALQVQPV